MSEPEVLIVEDDPVLVDVIERNLAARGLGMRSAAGVAAALAALEEGCPSVVVLDVDLPDGSGWEVLRALRRRGCRDTQPIVITGLRPNQRLVRELDCVAVLEKPFPIGSLVRLVQAYMSAADRDVAAPSK